ncbi:hypothetical protein SteCoe_644 [Stentor coeruleus]|uniref:Chorein N-terminal domain-containing protein n=1 Tax=Stentor coeruleus TaxID=5963 RepID=A0A1R2D3S4_9CILI|nr:hypothetical protein SteCoe_644 [Stentor coeruleus]
MVIKSTIYGLIKKYLAEYLYGFSKDQLEIELLSGMIELVNVNFKPTKVNELLLKKGQPIFLKCGLIGKLKIKYNYRNILSSPVEITINELLLVFGPILIDSNQEFIEQFDTAQSEDKDQIGDTHSEGESGDPFNLIENTMRSQTPNFALSLKGFQLKEDIIPKQEGIFEKYISTILQNLSITIDTMHIRYEDETYPYKHPFSITLLIESLEIKSASTEWIFDDNNEIKKQGITKKSSVKQGKIKSLSLHVNSMSGMLIPTTLWEGTLSSEIGIFEAFPACDVRELILQEGRMLVTDQTHHLLSPFSIEFCLTISQEKPFYKFSCLCDRMNLTISSSMGECLLNFREYTQNVNIWRKIHKFRPLERVLIEPHEENESLASKEYRKKITRNWFYYAYIFARFKVRSNHDELLAEIEAEKAKAENLDDKLNMSDFNIQVNEENKEDNEASGDMPDVDEGTVTNNRPGDLLSPENSQLLRPSIFIPKVAKTPGRSDKFLGQAIKEYNENLSEAVIDNIKATAKPFNPKPSIIFPKIIEFTSFDFKCIGVSVLLFDEEFKIKSETKLDTFYFKLRVSDSELNSFLNIGFIQSTVESEKRVIKVLEIGKIPDKSSNNKLIAEDAIEILLKLRPEERQYDDGLLPDRNMIELLGKISETKIQYSHQGLAEIMLIIETFRINRYYREYADLDYIRRIEQKRTSLTWKEKFVKKQRQILHRSVLKKLLMTKNLIRRILQWQAKLKEQLKDIDKKIQPILFDCKLETGGIVLEFFDENFNSTSHVFVPKGMTEFYKNKDYAKFSLWGFGVQTKQPLKHFYKYLIDISDITTKGVKKMRRMTKRQL